MNRLLRLVFLVGGAAPLIAVSSRGEAEIWNHRRADGTVEFTNRPRAGKGKGTDAPGMGVGKGSGVGGVGGVGSGIAGAGVRADASRAPPLAQARGRSSGVGEPAASAGGTFWARERADGVVEFTNLRPVGGQWKVWLKTGPGKAAALRGSTDVVPPRDVSPARYSRYDQDIHDQQMFYGIPEALIRAVMKVESDFDPRVVSSVGAQGLMQLMPDTARLMGVTDSFDPRQNIMGGARYLQLLARRFCRTPALIGGDRTVVPAATDNALICSDEEKIKVLAGYHAGPGAVEKYGGLPPYETTRAYVTMVSRRYEQYRRGPAAHAGAFVAEQ